MPSPTPEQSKAQEGEVLTPKDLEPIKQASSEPLGPDEVEVALIMPQRTLIHLRELAAITSKTDQPLELHELFQDMIRTFSWHVRYQVEGNTIGVLPPHVLDYLKETPLPGKLTTSTNLVNPSHLERARIFYGINRSLSSDKIP